MTKQQDPAKKKKQWIWVGILTALLIVVLIIGSTGSKDDPKKTVDSNDIVPEYSAPPEISPLPSESPEPSQSPEVTPEPVPSEEPSPSPVPSQVPEQSAPPESTPEPSAAPEQSAAPEPSAEPEPSPDPEPSPTPVDNAKDYVLNTHTMKIHYPGCKSVKDIKPENRSDVHKDREELIAAGYQPCGNCKP